MSAELFATTAKEAKAKREQNRALMPETAAFVDLCRREFGTVRVVYARENGHEVGTPTPDFDYRETDYWKAVEEKRK